MKILVYIFCFISSLPVAENVMAQQTERRYLSGTGSDHTVNWEFFCTAGRNAGKWTTIAVPSCWELQGFGKYDYGFAKDSIRGKERGLYRYRFQAPSTWKNKLVKIVFEGSMTDTEVLINGKSAGAIHQGAFYAFGYDISSLLKIGEENLLEVNVSKHSANTSVNEAERKADYWIFGGIFRPVYLEVLPVNHISSIAIDAKANGLFYARADVSVKGSAVLEVQLFTTDGRKVSKNIVNTFSKGNGVLVQANVAGIKPWSAETPMLYQAQFNLIQNGTIIHTVKKRFGFRTIKVKARDGVYVNDVKVKMKGVNRHSFHPESGRTTNRRQSIEEVKLMKEMNMNAVRMSHYPPDDHFLDACDSLGLFVMDELAGWHGHYDTETGKKLLKEMIDHDVNHPSIIFWSNGNEGGHNRELDHFFNGFDLQQRPVVHPWELFGNIETQHYREYNYGIGNYENGHEILMPTEFLHGQFDGGHGAGLEDYWEKMWRDPLSAGGFLWDFADQAVIRKDLNDSLDTDKHRGADGILGPYHQKEGSFFSIKQIWSPVYFERKEITEAFDGKLPVQNRFFYTNLEELKFYWKLVSFTGPFGGKNDSVAGQIISPKISPGNKGHLSLMLPAKWNQYDVLFITVRGRDGMEILNSSWPIKRPFVDNKFLTKNSIEEPREEISTIDTLINIVSGNTSYRFSRNSGRLIEVRIKDHAQPLTNGPILCEGNADANKVIVSKVDQSIIVETFYKPKQLINSLKWTIYPSGWLGMEIKYFPAAYFTSMVGVNFSFPEKDIKSVNYFGMGPYRVWKNRMKGGLLSVWNKDYNNTETGEFPWVYPEFKGYYANIYWAKLLTGTQAVTVVMNNEDIFLRLFTPAWKTDQWKNYEPIFPKGDISFMQGIPSIGTKTQRNETTGPMGLKNIYYDYEKEPSRALQMNLYFNFSEN